MRARSLFGACLVAAALPVGGAEIRGKIVMPNPQGRSVSVGYAAVDSRGKTMENLAGLTAGTAAGSVKSTTYNPRNTGLAWDPQAGATYEHVGLPPGTYAIFARMTEERGGQKRDVLSDLRIVRVPSAGARLSVDLMLSQARCGSLFITAPGRAGLLGVKLTPADDKGREVFPKADNCFALEREWDLSPRGTTITGLVQGPYRLTLRQLHRQGTPQTGQMTTFEELGTWTVRVHGGRVARYTLPSGGASGRR